MGFVHRCPARQRQQSYDLVLSFCRSGGHWVSLSPLAGPLAAFIYDLWIFLLRYATLVDVPGVRLLMHRWRLFLSPGRVFDGTQEHGHLVHHF